MLLVRWRFIRPQSNLEEAAAGYAANRLDARVSPEVQERASLTGVSACRSTGACPPDARRARRRGDRTRERRTPDTWLRLSRRPVQPRPSLLVKIWLRLEPGELERAPAAAAEVTEMGDRHGLKIIRLFGVTWQAGVDAVGALVVTTQTRVSRAAHQNMTDRVDTLRSVEVNEFVTFFDSVIGRLLIADDQDGAGPRLPGCGTAIRRRQ